MPRLLVARHLRRTYHAGDAGIDAIRDIDLDVAAGEFVAIVGPSGCGKSTLLHLCGAMDRPTEGRIEFEGTDLSRLDDERLARLRRTRIGFVFQSFNLLPTLTLAENIALPLLLDGSRQGPALEAARILAGRVGLLERRAHYPSQLSGGEQQRAAIARALVHRPALVVADEPTGNLDTDNGREVLRLLEELNRDLGVTVLLATHSTELAAAAGRVVAMRDGRIEPIDDGGMPGGGRAPV